MVQLKIKRKKIQFEPIENRMFDNFVLIIFVKTTYINVEISTKYTFMQHLQVDK